MHPHASAATPAKKKRADRALDPVAKFRQLQPYFADSEGGDGPSGERELQPYFSDMSGNEAFSDEDALQGGIRGDFNTPKGVKNGKTSVRVQRALERIAAAKLQGGAGQPDFYDFDGSRTGPRPGPSGTASAGPGSGRERQARNERVDDVQARQSTALDQLFASFMDRQTENMAAGKGEGDAQGERGDDNKAGLERLFGDLAVDGAGGQGPIGGVGAADVGLGRGRGHGAAGRGGRGTETPEDQQRREADENDAVAMLLGSISQPTAAPNQTAAMAVRQQAEQAGQAAMPRTEKAKGLLAMLNSRPMAGGGHGQRPGGGGVDGVDRGQEEKHGAGLLSVLAPYRTQGHSSAAAAAVRGSVSASGQQDYAQAPVHAQARDERAGPAGSRTTQRPDGSSGPSAAAEERARRQRALLEQITAGVGVPEGMAGGGGEGLGVARGSEMGMGHGMGHGAQMGGGPDAAWVGGGAAPISWTDHHSAYYPPPPHNGPPAFAQPQPPQPPRQSPPPSANPAPGLGAPYRPPLNDQQRSLLGALGMRGPAAPTLSADGQGYGQGFGHGRGAPPPQPGQPYMADYGPDGYRPPPLHRNIQASSQGGPAGWGPAAGAAGHAAMQRPQALQAPPGPYGSGPGSGHGGWYGPGPGPGAGYAAPPTAGGGQWGPVHRLPG